MAPSATSPKYYKFDVGQLDDELYRPNVPVTKWLDTVTTAGEEGFPPNSLHVLHDIPWDVHVERVMGIALYMAWNVLPFALPLLCLLAYLFPVCRPILYFILLYVAILDTVLRFFFTPYFVRKYKLGDEKTSFFSLMGDSIQQNQFLFTERNISKYLSVSFVWSASMQRPNMEKTPLIFCAIPHGVAPIGITAYPLWSCLWNDRICRWTAAPLVLKIPLVGFFMNKIGYIPASSKPILETLTKKEQNVGIILDGIDGMFQPVASEEIAVVKKRKGIVKIALRAGVPLVPVFGFGHTSLWTVVVDPFGLLKKLSHMMGASLTPFFGRWGWFLGPPRRIPITVCLGEPVKCPQVAEPTQEQIDKYHQQLLDSYQELFEIHKAAYGWKHKTLHFV